MIDEHLKLVSKSIHEFVKVKRNVNKHFDRIWMVTTDDFILLSRRLSLYDSTRVMFGDKKPVMIDGIGR